MVYNSVPKAKAEIVSINTDEGLYCEIHSNEPTRNGDHFSFGSFEISPDKKSSKGLTDLQELFDRYSNTKTIPTPEEFCSAINGHYIAASFGMDPATIASGYSDLYNQLSQPPRRTELIIIPTEHVDHISGLANQIGEALKAIEIDLKSYIEPNHPVMHAIESTLFNLKHQDKHVLPQELGELWRLMFDLPNPESVMPITNLATSLSELLEDPVEIKPNESYKFNYQILRELVNQCSLACAQQRIEDQNSGAKTEVFNYGEVPGSIRWFTVAPTDHRSLQEIADVTKIPFDLLTESHPNHPDLTHPGKFNRVVLNTITLKQDKEAGLSFHVAEAILIFNEDTLIVQVDKENADIMRLRSEILNSSHEELSGLTPSLLVAKLIRTNLHSLKKAAGELDDVVTAFVSTPLKIPSAQELQRADSYIQWASKIKANGIYMSAVVNRLSEKKTHSGRPVNISERISSYQTMAVTSEKIGELTIKKINERTTGWDHQIDRQDSMLNLKLTALAGFVVPVSVVSSIFGQNIAGFAGAPSWVVVTANASALIFGGMLTYRLYQKKNAAKQKSSLFRPLV